MSHLWIRNAEGALVDHPLDTGILQLTPDGPAALAVCKGLDGVSGPVLARKQDFQGEERWVLLCKPTGTTRVNGVPVFIGVRMLSDRDLISLGAGHRVFFSSERVAQIEPFPGEEDNICCVRCKLPLQPGKPAVRCPAPGCGFWHHQSDEQPCWSYRDGCASCGHPTAFDAGFQWSPAVL